MASCWCANLSTKNAVKGILLAYFTLVNDKTGIEKMRVPFVLPGLRGEGLKIEIDPSKT